MVRPQLEALVRTCLFKEMLAERERKAKTLVCVGLDPIYRSDKQLLPMHLDPGEDMWTALRFWGFGVVDATAEHALCFKPNLWYWLNKQGGLAALIEVVEYIRKKYLDIPVILDYKVGDIGATSQEAAEFAFDMVKVHAVTATPYVGMEALKPLFERRPDHGVIIVAKTSNNGAEEFQDFYEEAHGLLFELVARSVVGDNEDYGNLCLVAGATQPRAVGGIRQIVGDDIPLLVPGLGKQGGSVEEVIPVAINSRGGGVMANSSSGISHASNGRDFAQAAEKAAEQFKREINHARKLA